MNKFRIVKVTHYNRGVSYRVEEFLGKFFWLYPMWSTIQDNLTEGEARHIYDKISSLGDTRIEEVIT
jgi:hypothetical protein